MFSKNAILICFGVIWMHTSQSQNCSIMLSDGITQNGRNLLNTRYESGTLDKTDREQLCYSNDKFDCVTFIEYILALSILHTQQETKDLTFEQILTNIRYKNGVIDGYGSRLHYFTSWILQNKTHGYIDDITPELGGEPWQKKIDYMSTHPEKYPRLNQPNDITKLKKIENELSKVPFHYIPKSKVQIAQKQIRNGDIIAITTDIPGLDIVHTGIAVLKNGMVHLMHASSDAKKVVISQESLDQYLKSKRNQTGIMVLRPKCPED